jgi:hypothetical protein
MKKTSILTGLAAMFCIAAQAQNPVLPPGKIAVFKAGTSDNNWPMVTARVAPCFVQVFDPALTNQSSTNPVVSVAMSTNSSVPGSVWINHHAGSEGGGISLSINREYLCLEGYVGNILSATAAKPSTDPTVARGVVTLDAFTNAVDVYSSLNSWFGIPQGANPANNQDNPTGLASTDGTNFWGTGNFAGTSSELDGTLFYNSFNGNLQEVQQFIQAAGEAHIVNGTLFIATKPAAGVASGLYNFVDPASGSPIPLPWDPDAANPYFGFAFTNLYLNWGNTFQNVLNFDMDPAQTVAYGADQTFGIVKFTNNSGTWVQAPYYFNATNLDTLAQTAGNQGCFGICVDFSGTNPVIYATTMENGGSTNYPGGFGVNSAAGHQNNNRIIKIVDTGIAPGTNVVAQTLAVASTTNEFFGGITFTPDLAPLITSQPADYATTNGGSASFAIGVQSVYALSYQWLQNSSILNNQTNSSLSLSNLDTTFNDFIYQCVVTNAYGSVTSTPAVLGVTIVPVPPVITSVTNLVSGFVDGNITFAPVAASGTQPFTYQWYFNGTGLVDDGVKYFGSATASLTISNLSNGDAGSYYMVVMNPSTSYASNIVDLLSVNYLLANISAGQPASVTTFTNLPTSLTASESGASLPVTNQWYVGSTMLTDGTEYTGTQTPTLSIAATTTADTATNYYLVVSNPGGSVTSILASVSVLIPPAPSSVGYTNQLYVQTFDGLPDPGTQGAKSGVAVGNGASVNSFNNPKDPGQINVSAYSLANPFDFAYPVINNSYIGGLALGTGPSPTNLSGWYGAADTNTATDGVDGITRFGAQAGDQSTGGVIDFGPNDVEGGLIGTNRALGLISTGTTGSTAYGVKLINNTTNTLNYINVSFLGELWRNNTGTRTMSFSYAVDPTASSFVLLTQPDTTSLTPQDLPNAITVPNLAFSFPTNPTGTLAVDGTQPANQIAMATNNMALATPWAPSNALWLVWSINYYGAGSGQGYAIDNLNVSGTTVPTTTPTATTAAASKIAATTAQFNGSVNPSNGPTAYWFQYGTTVSYGSSTPTNLLGVVSGTAAIANSTTGLLPGQVYHYRAVATNIAGTSLGSDSTFTTLTPPAVTTLTASNITASSATLDASVNPSGTATGYWFKYGTTVSYGSITTTNTLAAGSSVLTVTNRLTGLLQGTLYHYLVVATNAGGTSSGTDKTFTTLAVTPPNLGGVTFSSGAFRLAFTNATGASFSVLATNNLTAPRTNWPVVGHPVESPAGSGNYQFTNSPATNGQEYYLLRQP